MAVQVTDALFPYVELIRPTIFEEGQPATPTNVRNRAQDRGAEAAADASPTSTYSESTPVVPNASFHSTANSGLTTKRKVIVRSDPAMLTCFDPADKELYDLWAPKH